MKNDIMASTYVGLANKVVVQGMEELSPFIEQIHYDSIRNFVTTALYDYTPISFWVLPASSSGKFHPPYSRGVGGLIKHTKATLIVANELFPIYLDFNNDIKDKIISALLLHDICKPAKNHAMLVRKHLEDLKGVTCYPTIISLIESHMGQWNEGNAPFPKTAPEKFVHLCDYIASRKDIQINLDKSVDNKY